MSEEGTGMPPVDEAYGDPPTPTQVEVDEDTHEDEHGRTWHLFLVPRNLPEARSAYAYDPGFNVAVDTYADQVGARPEQVLTDNLGRFIGVEERLVSAEGGGSSPENRVPALDYTPDATASAAADDDGDELPSLTELREQYVEGDITLTEFEDRVEEVLDE